MMNEFNEYVRALAGFAVIQKGHFVRMGKK
jgi:hypothetical protein